LTRLATDAASAPSWENADARLDASPLSGQALGLALDGAAVVEAAAAALDEATLVEAAAALEDAATFDDAAALDGEAEEVAATELAVLAGAALLEATAVVSI
jgi:hypothetical protein